MARAKNAFTPARLLGLLVAVLAFAIPWIIHFHDLSEAGHRVFAIFLMAVVLWVTEAIPLHATAALIILLNILLASSAAVIPLPKDYAAPAYTLYFNALANPVLMLFLGGFFLADGAAKYGLDKNLARVLLKPFGTKPDRIILGLMVIAAVFSMFMSNTATTATLMAVVLPVAARLPAGDKGKIALILCIPFAANIGGMGTPVGTPPNAIALGALNKAGIQVSFIEWMIMVMPFMLVLLLFTWFVLTRIFRSKATAITIDIQSTFDRSPQARLFYVVAGATILLWFTEPLHGIQSSIVGFLPVVVMLATRLISDKEFHSMQWSVLWLVAGGIALGDGVAKTGLDKWLIALIDWENMAPGMVAGALCVTALLFSTIISNSATANLLIPIGMSLAASPAVSMSPLNLAIFIALGSSLAMALPISTPPNAIAYATGTVQTKQMAIAGTFVAIAGLPLFIWLAPRVWAVMGMMNP
ncbi:MAG TPA: SLC13 family permease [Kiritimatiellia bacterium]|nr:SLC13 family permease [Kiritimatiellia bacterium]